MDEGNDLVQRVREFVAARVRVRVEKVASSTRLEEDLGLYGDDFHELIDDFGKGFDVDVSGYRWYHHTGPEGCNPFWLLIKPRWARVTHIPVSVDTLVEAVKIGSWPVEYPQENVRPSPDAATWILWFLLLTLVALVIIALIQ